MKSFGKRAAGQRLERMRASPRWLETGFVNHHPIASGLRDPSVAPPTATEFLFSRGRRYPDAPLPVADPRGLWRKTPASGLRATWLGHSTVLIEIDGFRVLTDPVWGTRASPLRLLGPRRFQPAPVRLRDMPPVDVVVISHDHYDHLDYPTIRALSRADNVPFVTSLGVGAHLQAWGVAPERITELDWWDSHRVPGTGLTIQAAPAQHFSGRTFGSRNATLWSSLVVRGDRHCVFFSGDTGLTSEYESIRSRLGPFDLVMLEIGALHPSWGDMHLGPINALRAHQLLGGGALLPVHWGTFSLAMHDWDEPIETLLSEGALRESALLLPAMGQAVEPAHGPQTAPWWRTVGANPELQSPAPPSEELVARDGEKVRAFPWPFD